MKDFRRLFVLKNGLHGPWTDTTDTTFTISVVNDVLSVECKSGRDMFVQEINTAFGKFIKEYESEFGEKVAFYERQYPYRFCYRQGSSGCQDTYIEIDVGDGFPVRKFMMHETCFGKCGSFRCYVYDFLDICVASGFFGIEDGFYVYQEEEDNCSGQFEMQIVKPRILRCEEGWTSPWERPKEVVYLAVCREEPNDSDETEN